jgi:3-oxoacyl-[acyl-carrier protein] reductase
MESLAGKTALVTGGSRGIGKAIAIALASAGVKVTINFEKNGDAAAAVAKTTGGRAIQADLSSESDIRSLIEQTGPVDILVNNAGIIISAPWQDLTLDDFNHTLQVNLTPAFILTQAVLPAMIEKGYGRIIYISSTAAHTGGVIGPHYAASKAGLIGLMHGYASRVADKGVTVNAIAPGMTATDMIKDNPHFKPEKIPVQRFGLPEEIAATVLLLASNGYITGQTLGVNGGLYFTS